MPCEKPMTVWKVRPTQAQHGTKVQVPCGTCFLCRQEYARQWAIRLMHEASRHEKNAFITLTYDNTHTPPDGGLRYEDLQKFWKRLRKDFGKLSYYAVGEYGDKTNRPHFHACVFGLDFSDEAITIRQAPTRLYTSMALQKAWGMGLVSAGAITFETARYTASYVMKKLGANKTYRTVDEETGELIALEQPKAMMSRNLAVDWWRDWKQGVIDHDRVVVQGRPQKPPKAYDRWLKAENQKIMDEIKKKRIAKMERRTENQTRAHARNARAHAKRRIGSV